MAFVVAIAGIMFPAISVPSQTTPVKAGKGTEKGEERAVRLMSNFDFVGMEKIVERMFAVDATKSRVSTSSLSKVRTCTQSGF